MPRKGAQREVIAHYSAKRLAMMALVWTAFIGIPLYMIDLGYRDPIPGKVPLWLWGAMFLLVLLPLLPGMIRLLLGSALAGGAALWIENGRLVYADRWTLDVPLADVISIDMVSTFSSSRGGTAYVESIFIRLANGREAKVWAEFVENEGEVVNALQERLGLKATGDLRK